VKGVGLNAVEIEQAVSELAEKPFDAEEFPFAFLEAFGRKAVTLKKLRSGDSNRSDLGGVLQTGHIHIKVAEPGAVTEALQALKASPATARAKARFVLATDGATLEAEDMQSDDAPVVCAYADFPDRFAAFLPLAGITTVRQVRESSFDIRATGRLNKLYLELRRLNPGWDRAERRPDMNHFLARLIFCFFAQSTDIFFGEGLFSDTVAQMSARDGSDAHAVIEAIFRAMSLGSAEKAAAGLPRWAEGFPRVNGWLFSGDMAVPRFNGIARSYLLHIGGLDWRKINPDIFGSMIQAVAADDDERGALGMHYTSVPNILKVLNPLFLDDLWSRLAEAGDNARTLLSRRRRLSRIRVFDPACGSGNFLVIAYKEMRAIEKKINKRRGEEERKTEIPLTNFRGIEIRDFPAEVARLALIIAEYQCDVLYRGQKEALKDFLPLDAQNWITCGNALRLDWLNVCPPTGTGVKHRADDLFDTPLDQAEIDFENSGGDTYICGNPPYLGFTWQNETQKNDLRNIFEQRTPVWRSLDYVSGWLMKSADYGGEVKSTSSFVMTNSVCQGEQASNLWPLIFSVGQIIVFARTSFKWTNLAKANAGVMVVIVGISNNSQSCTKKIYSENTDGSVNIRTAENINAYLVTGPNVVIGPITKTPVDRGSMAWGNKPSDGGYLSFDTDERDIIIDAYPIAENYIRPYYGALEYIRGVERFCIWVSDDDAHIAKEVPAFRERFEAVRNFRAASKAAETRLSAAYPHRFRQIQSVATLRSFIIPQVGSERRMFIPIGLLPERSIVSNLAFAIYDAELWNIAVISSRIHMVWVSTTCGRLKTDIRYSNTLGWNTFPVPPLTEKNKADLTRCAEHILLAREAHYPATIADLYDPDAMPDDLRAAHERNDEVLERIYIGRRFRNDTERLEKLFEMYTKMTATEAAKAAPKPTPKRRGRAAGAAPP
jgi:hypothetical protein